MKVVGTILAALVILTGSAAGAKDKPAIALFPILNFDDNASPIIDSINDLLFRGAELIPEISIVSGANLQKRLRVDPGQAQKKCGDDIQCTLALGKKAAVAQVLLGRAAIADESVRVTFIVLDVAKQALLRKLVLNFSSVDDVKPVLGGSFYTLMGISDPGYFEVKHAHDEVKLDGTFVGQGDGIYEASPGRHILSVGSFEKALMIVPNKTVLIDIGTTVPSAPSASPERGTDTATPVAGILPAHDSAALTPSEWLRYSAYGMGAVGALCLLFGAYNGVRANNTANVPSGASGPNQRQLVDIENSANAYNNRANLFFELGAGAAVLGGALFGISYYFNSHSANQISISSKGNDVALTFRW